MQSSLFLSHGAVPPLKAPRKAASALGKVRSLLVKPPTRFARTVRSGHENVAIHSLQSLDDPLTPLLASAGDDAPVRLGVSVGTTSTPGHGPATQPMGTATASMQEEENPYTQQDALSSGADGEVELERLLAEQGAELTVDRVCQVFPYPLDGFQRKALEKFLEGRSVVVCAPTGAGKTAIAEAAAAAVLARGQRVIYTTPLKALSNQKLFEMRKRFGQSRCGLQTGDTSLNTDADIVIMTTEILRNIMYRTAETLPDDSEPGVSAGDGSATPVGGRTREDRLGTVGLIVMDEVHYLGDPSRGSVWEEAIINCPRHIQLLCMSATVKNPDDLGAWIGKEHQDCATIKTRFRPVPLHWHFAYNAPPPKGVQVIDLLAPNGKGLNPKLETRNIVIEEARGILGRSSERLPARGGRGSSKRAFEDSLLDMVQGDSQMQRKMMSKRVPNMEALILRLRKLNYLPAIWFILSRKECDLSAIKVGAGQLVLTSEAEQAEIKAEVNALAADQAEAVREQLVAALIKGVASHHAGHLPGWKSMIERLFQRGLLKIVFATGTLAAGINMPARTTIISALSRMTDDGPALLPHNELLQMAGRAGRRGYDVEGHCIVLQTRFEGPDAAWSILRAGPESLASQFNASYGLVLNLLSVYSLEQAREFCNKSFGNYLRTDGSAKKAAEVAELEAAAAKILEEYAAMATTSAKTLNANVKAARDRLRDLRVRVVRERLEAARTALDVQGLPRKVVLNLAKVDAGGGKATMLPAVLMDRVEDDLEGWPKGGKSDGDLGQSGPFYYALGADNRLLRVSLVHVAGTLEGEEGTISEEDSGKVWAALEGVRVNEWANLTDGQTTVQAAAGNSSTAVVALQLQAKKWHVFAVAPELASEVVAAKQAVKDANTELELHRRSTSGGDSGKADRAAMEKVAAAKRLQKRADQLKLDMRAAGENTWRNFTGVVEILQAMGALDVETLSILPLGLTARSIQGQNELWLALVLSHPTVYGMTGPELAGLLGAILTGEVLRKSGAVWTAYPSSPRVVEAVEALEEQRQLLAELQADAGLGQWNETLIVDLRTAGIVEAWAAGATWKQIMEDSNLDDGDIARLLVRTLDLLKQIKWNGALLPHLQEPAIEALRGMDRKPIAEVLF